LFIDEIESMGAKRQQDRGFGGQADMNMTLNTLLTEMDGFHGSKIIVIGATNNDGMLDPRLCVQDAWTDAFTSRCRP
jgi:cell division protease FtsH